MSDTPKLSNDELQEYSKEQLELIQAFNQIFHSKQNYSQLWRHQEQLHENAIKTQEINLKHLDLSLQSTREASQPHRVYHAEVLYDPNEQKYMCRMVHMFMDTNDEDMVTPIVAYGDTPAQACAEFDYLWVHGKRKNDD